MTPTSTSNGALAEAVVMRCLGLLDPEVRLTVPLEQALFADERVCAARARTRYEGLDVEAWHREITRLAITLARDVLPVWSRAYPKKLAPVRAVEAAEEWAACPCELHAGFASDTMPQVVDAFGSVWRLEPKQAAWAGRTAAWVADAPRFKWQSVSAISGACRATSVDHVIGVAERFFTAAR